MAQNLELRREPRYRITTDGDIDVLVSDAANEASYGAELVDISQNGAKLRINQALEVETALRIAVAVKSIECQIQVSGDVCWVSPAGQDDWFIGCAFRPAVPERVLAHLAGAGFTDRRDSDRDAISLETTVRWELSRDSSAVSVVNLSRGGFCMLCPNPGEPGRHVLLQFEEGNPDPILIKARSRWHMAHQGEYLVGCEFLDRHGYNLMRELHHASDLHQASHPSSPWRRLLRR